MTGGCGFIGLNLIRFLHTHAKNHVRIRVIDNLSVGKRQALERFDQVHALKGSDDFSQWSDQVQFIEGDVREPADVEQCCTGADAVIHLAASTGIIQSIENPLEDCRNNVFGTLVLLESCRRKKVRRFVFASSSAPLGEILPPAHENIVPRPISPYGASKLSGEAYCSAYRRSFGLSAMALRFSNIYGPFSWHKTSVVSQFMKHILEDAPLIVYGDGKQTRDFLFVEDLVDVLWQTLLRGSAERVTYQLGTGRETSINELLTILSETAEAKLGRMPPIQYVEKREGEIERNFTDISLAAKELGWNPRTPVKEGIRRTFEWFLAQGREGDET